ncbi:MAG: hypothetical protein MZV63_13730 [Marinilabiliales bacterium]|nr:hypothetical protein [Marinilabiliales bacterium]
MTEGGLMSVRALVVVMAVLFAGALPGRAPSARPAAGDRRAVSAAERDPLSSDGRIGPSSSDEQADRQVLRHRRRPLRVPPRDRGPDGSPPPWAISPLLRS